MVISFTKSCPIEVEGRVVSLLWVCVLTILQSQIVSKLAVRKLLNIDCMYVFAHCIDANTRFHWFAPLKHCCIIGLGIKYILICTYLFWVLCYPHDTYVYVYVFLSWWTLQAWDCLFLRCVAESFDIVDCSMYVTNHIWGFSTPWQLPGLNTKVVISNTSLEWLYNIVKYTILNFEIMFLFCFVAYIPTYVWLFTIKFMQGSHGKGIAKLEWSLYLKCWI